MSYESFATLYDTLMYDQPYDKWLEISQPYLSGARSVLDLGCGTGNYTILLPQSMRRVGVDLSEEMLKVARTKDDTIEWIADDMVTLQLSETFDVITIFCDSINYITDEDDLLTLFHTIKQHLNANGTLLFDSHSIWKMEHLFSNGLYSDETEDIMYIWHANAGEEPNSVWHDITFFVQDNDIYKRFDESHFQRTFPVEMFKQLLEIADLQLEKAFGDFNPDEEVSDDVERIFYVVKHAT